MLKLLPFTALALGLSSGVALADHHGDHRGGDRRAVVEHRSAPQVVVRDHRDVRGGDWHRGAVVREGRPYYGGGSRVVIRGDHRGYYNNYSYRRPIYVSRPIIRERYFDHYRRPALVVENYGPRDGYYWVVGQWTWNGYEWLWQPGHYEPDPSYNYNYDYDPGY